MIANGDERSTLNQTLTVLLAIFTLGNDLILDAKLLEHAARKVWSAEMSVAIIERIDLVDRKKLHGTSGESAPYPSTKDRGELLQFFKGKERHCQNGFTGSTSAYPLASLRKLLK